MFALLDADSCAMLANKSLVLSWLIAAHIDYLLVFMTKLSFHLNVLNDCSN
jgi:hypothetical protein